MPQEVNLTFKFAIPPDAVLATARKMAGSANQDERDVGKTVVEVTDIARQTQAAITNTAKLQGNYDLAVYFDYKFGASLEAANRLKLSPVDEVRVVAECLIGQSKTITESKAAFLASVQKK
jgi:hypothetical protein